MEEGDIPSFFFAQDLGLALNSGENACPSRAQAFKMAKNGQAFPYDKNKRFSSFFLNESIAGTPRHVCKMFHADILTPDCVGSTTSNGNYTWFPLESPDRCPRRFLDVHPDCTGVL